MTELYNSLQSSLTSDEEPVCDILPALERDLVGVVCLLPVLDGFAAGLGDVPLSTGPTLIQIIQKESKYDILCN